jgi:predicted MFS family arabinose efflux permease
MTFMTNYPQMARKLWGPFGWDAILLLPLQFFFFFSFHFLLFSYLKPFLFNRLKVNFLIFNLYHLNDTNSCSVA